MAAIPRVRCATLGYWILPPSGDDGRENWIFAHVPILTERSIVLTASAVLFRPYRAGARVASVILGRCPRLDMFCPDRATACQATFNIRRALLSHNSSNPVCANSANTWSSSPAGAVAVVAAGLAAVDVVPVVVGESAVAGAVELVGATATDWAG